MKLTIEIDNKNELEKLKALFKLFKIDKVNVISNDNAAVPVVKGDKKLDPKSLFSIWADNPRDIETIRKSGWQRK
ncbi:MAG: hypothetical protein JSU01_23045 [Bacteroidetes bacterium]|nr:hypothetical protein [Bacteroidota bacterium]